MMWVIASGCHPATDNGSEDARIKSNFFDNSTVDQTERLDDFVEIQLFLQPERVEKNIFSKMFKSNLCHIFLVKISKFSSEIKRKDFKPNSDNIWKRSVSLN